MRSVARILLCSACLLTLAVAPAAYADDEDDAPKSRQTAKSKREARRNKDEDALPKGTIGKEMAALGEAATLLSQVKDEAAAKAAADKLCKKFASMPPVLGGSDSELEMLAKAQNKVSDQMERLMSTSYFVSSGLQDAWTLMTDPFSRRSAQRGRRK